MIYRIEELSDISVIYIGQRGENISRNIDIDVSAWRNEFPNATFIIFAQRPYEKYTYEVDTELNGNILTWHPSNADTAIVGTGRMEVHAVDGEILKKTMPVTTQVRESLTDDGSGTNTTPEAIDAWRDKVLKITATIEQAKGDIDSVKDEIAEILSTLPADYTKLCSDVGDISLLETEDKSSLVAAINEAAKTGGSLGGDSLFVVRITKVSLGGILLMHADKTQSEVREAVASGKACMVYCTDGRVYTYIGEFPITSVEGQPNAPTFVTPLLYPHAGSMYYSQIQLASDNKVHETQATVLSAVAVHGITFTGAVNAYYDGAEPVTVTIPAGGEGGGIDAEPVPDSEVIDLLAENDLMLAVMDESGILADENGDIIEW